MSNGTFPIQTLNAISPVGLSRLDRDVFDIGTDGKASNQREFGKLEGQGANADGITIDSEGRLYVTVNGGSLQGVQVLDKTGKYLGVIPTPRQPITLAFGGTDKKLLYIGAMGATSLGGEQIQFAPGVRAVSMKIGRAHV